VVVVWVVRPWGEFVGAYTGIIAAGHTAVDYRAHRLAYGALTLPSTSLLNYAGTIARFGLLPAVLWILWFQRKQHRANLVLFWLAFSLLAVIGFVSGEKGPALLLLLGFVIAFLLRPNVRILDWRVLGAIAAGALIIVPVLYHLQYPNQGYTELIGGQINRLMLEYSRTGQLRFIFYPDQQPFLWGRSSLGIGHILRFLGIPTGNVEAPENYIPEHVSDAGPSYGGTWNTGFMPEAWADFGWLGVIASSLIVGILVVLAKRWFDEGPRGPLQLGTYAALCVSALYLTDVRLTTALWTFGGALSFVIYVILSRFPAPPNEVKIAAGTSLARMIPWRTKPH
jgi:oligosaccharide repeat unit polymerase